MSDAEFYQRSIARLDEHLQRVRADKDHLRYSLTEAEDLAERLRADVAAAEARAAHFDAMSVQNVRKLIAANEDRDRLASLLEKLRPHVGHRLRCDAFTHVGPCTCGLADLLAEIPREDP